jgi:Major Facilitator Superfamily
VSGPAPDRARARQAYRYDRVRGAMAGLIEAGWLSFTMIVVIRHFDAPPLLKALLNAAGSIGLLLTPLSTQLASRGGFRPVRVCAVLWASVSLLLGLLAWVDTLAWFASLFFLGALCLAQQSPMNIQIYSQNYAPGERGRWLSKVAVLASLSGGIFGWVGGRLLDLDLGRNYPVLYLIMSAGAAVAAWAYTRIPSDPLPSGAAMHPFQHLALARTDRLFGQMLAGWMMLGFANLMTLPIRVEYLANPDYGIHASNQTIALVLVMLPLLVRLCTTRWWGRVFDRVGLVRMRNWLNLLFLLGIGCFFLSHQIWIIALGAALHGFAQSGGDIIWQLWVTKLAPPDRVSHYMSVHTLNTGLRGVIAPFFGYWLLRWSHNPQVVGLISVILMALAIVYFHRIEDDGRLAAGARQPADDLAPAAAATDGDPAT